MNRSLPWVGFLSMLVLLTLAPAMAQAQGFLVVTDADHMVRLPRPIIIYPPPYPPRPRPIPPSPPPIPPASYKVQELDVQARVKEQVAQVQVSQSFVNTGSRQLEVQFIFPLPYDGAVDRMTLLVDGREMPARLLKADEARRLYEDIVRRSKDPALLEWIGTGLFKTSVFPVPPGQKRTVSLRYTQLCRKQEGLTDFLFPMSAAKYTTDPLEKLSLRVTIESQTEIKKRLQPDSRRQHPASGRQARHGQLLACQRDPHGRLPPALRRGPRHGDHQRDELPARTATATRTATSSSWPARKSSPPPRSGPRRPWSS